MKVDFNISFKVCRDSYVPKIRQEYVDNPNLNIYHPKLFNPVVEELMDKVVSTRSIPLDDGIMTLYAIREKVPFMTEYLNYCIETLFNYRKNYL